MHRLQTIAAVLSLAATCLLGQDQEEVAYLNLLKFTDRPADESFVPAVLKVAQFYHSQHELQKAADVLLTAYQKQLSALVAPAQSVPILEQLEIEYWSLRNPGKDAEILGLLVDAASKDSESKSLKPVRYLLEQARPLEKPGGPIGSKIANARADQILHSLDEPDGYLAMDQGSGTVPPTGISGSSLFRVGGGVSSPKLLRRVDPLYSEAAKNAHLEGTVVLKVVINRIGMATEFKVIRSLGQGLDEAAIDAVERWQFEPGMKDGKPVRVVANIEVHFHLGSNPLN